VAEALRGKGKRVYEIARVLGVTDTIYYNWLKRVEQPQRSGDTEFATPAPRERTIEAGSEIARRSCPELEIMIVCRCNVIAAKWHVVQVVTSC
jgi:transposase-like protein